MEKGDIVYIDYELWALPMNELVETTYQKVAVEHKIFDDKKVYKPLPHVVGSGKPYKLLDESIMSAELDKEYVIDIPPSEGAGERNPDLVKLYSLRHIMRLPEFSRKGMQLDIGVEITVGNMKGRIVGITAGRVRVDFNTKLAGKTLRYKYKVVKKADNLEDKVRAIIDMNYRSKSDFQIILKNSDVDLILPDVCKTDKEWALAKFRIISDLRAHTQIQTVRFIEEYFKPVEKAEERKEEKV
jgi:FKBP-type peptidyl-prolyl cis-trans isomerase 2